MNIIAGGDYYFFTPKGGDYSRVDDSSSGRLFQILLAKSANVLIRELPIEEIVKYTNVAIEILYETCALV